ncbi:hypothetical protein GGD38_002575 [Chitinophagaceae bacterium OAS944]|nr:hypothetical protein [Chitinophagaceae bacterium OAS944]
MTLVTNYAAAVTYYDSSRAKYDTLVANNET